MVMGETTYVDTWKAMEKLLGTGKVKAIGVSNFSKGEIETLLREGSVVSGWCYGQVPISCLLTTCIGSSGSPDGRPSVSPAEGFQRLAQGKGNSRHAVQPIGQLELILQGGLLEQDAVAHGPDHRPSYTAGTRG